LSAKEKFGNNKKKVYLKSYCNISISQKWFRQGDGNRTEKKQFWNHGHFENIEEY